MMVDTIRKTYLKTKYFSKFKKFQPVLKIAGNSIQNEYLLKCNLIDKQLYFVIRIGDYNQFVPRIIVHVLKTCETVNDFNIRFIYEFIKTVQ